MKHLFSDWGSVIYPGNWWCYLIHQWVGWRLMLAIREDGVWIPTDKRYLVRCRLCERGWNP